MPSQLHETLVDIFHRRPELAAVLLGRRVRRARVHRADASSLDPTTLLADTVILLDGCHEAVILEVQLRPDRHKRAAWAFYVAAKHRDLGRPVTLVVLTLSTGVAAWARAPIVLGPGSVVQPVVIGPGDVPQAAAADDPEHTLLAFLCAARPRDAFGPAVAAARASLNLDEDTSRRYLDLILSHLAPTQRRDLERIMQQDWQPQSHFLRRLDRRARQEGRAEGHASGLREALLKVLVRRFSVVPPQVEGAVLAADVERLTRMLDAALTATRPEEVLR